MSGDRTTVPAGSADRAFRALASNLMFIGGERVRAASGDTYESENVFTRETWAIGPDAGQADVDAAVVAARAALSGHLVDLLGV